MSRPVHVDSPNDLSRPAARRAVRSAGTWLLCSIALACADAGSDTDRTSLETDLERLAPSNPKALDPGVAQAVETALARVRSTPEDPAARFDLGCVYDANSLYASALEAYDQTVRIDPQHARAQYHAARMLAELGRLDEAGEALDRTLALAPEYAAVWRRSAERHLRAGRLELAREQYQRVAELEPEWPDGALGLARAALAEGDAELAATHARAVLAQHPDVPYAQHLLGSAMRDLGRADEAQEAFARAAGGAPRWRDPWTDEVEARVGGYSRIMLEARTLLAAGHFDEASARLAALHRDVPDDVTVQGMWTAALTQSGRFDEALTMLTAARTRQPDHFRIELNLALVQRRRGELELARTHVERSIALHPEHAAAHLVHGQVLGDLQAAEGALAAFREALRYGAEPHRVLPRIGSWEVALQRFDAAARTYELAVRERPDDGSLHATLAGCRAETGDLSGAREALLRARELSPQHKLLPAIEARLEQLEGTDEP